MSNDNNNNIKLIKKVKIKTNRKTFISIAIVNKCIEIIIFEENCFCIQINIIENCNKKIIIKSTAYTRLAIMFLSNGS